MNSSNKALVGLLLAGVAGIVIFFFINLSGGKDDSISIGSKSAHAACPRGQRDCLPEVNYIDSNGTAYTTASLTGKVVVVNFWATWCKPCLAEIPDLSKVYEKHKARGLVMLGIMTDDPDANALLNFQSDHEMTYPVVRANSDILVSYQYPGALPTTFVFDRSGKQIYSHVGAIRIDQLERLLEPLLAN